MASALDERTLLLPEGTRLVHIGPHKTGTTSLQSALFAGRAAMRDQGVRHVGRTHNPANAVRAVTGQVAATSTDRPPPLRYWRDLRREFRSAKEPRVVLSSEFFAWAAPDVIRRIAAELGQERLHIAVTLRPLPRILPSQWQQNVQAGSTMAYERWLRRLLDEPESRAGSSFWTLHRHDRLIARWADVVGHERLTAVVVDDRDHGQLLRVFESLLGLLPGTLVAPRDLANRSMTLPEVEAVRAFNRACTEAGIHRAVHAKVMRYGAAGYMKTRRPEPSEPRIETPQWALDRAGDIAAEMVAAIGASGVRVVGDLESLLEVPRSGLQGDRLPEVSVPPEIAATMAMGVLVASGLARVDGGRLVAAEGGASAWIEPIEVARVPTLQLAAVLLRRLRGAALRRLRGGARRVRRRSAAS